MALLVQRQREDPLSPLQLSPSLPKLEGESARLRLRVEAVKASDGRTARYRFASAGKDLNDDARLERPHRPHSGRLDGSPGHHCRIHLDHEGGDHGGEREREQTAEHDARCALREPVARDGGLIDGGQTQGDCRAGPVRRPRRPGGGRRTRGSVA